MKDLRMGPIATSARIAWVAAVAAVLSATAARASVTISTDATQNMSCTAGVCSPTAKKAVLNVDDLTAMLTTEDVKITTGNGAVTITVLAPFSWTSTHRLTLDAFYNVTFQAPMTVSGTGAVTIVTNDGGTGGDLLFFSGGKLDFWDTNSSLVVEQQNYTLVQNIAVLASDIERNPAGLYALVNDYDASQDRFSGQSALKTTFHGAFEGLGHTISNLNLVHKSPRKRNLNLGLFRSIAVGGIVRDIAILNGTLRSRTLFGNNGLLAAENSGTILHSSSSGTLEISDSIQGSDGGLVGFNDGLIGDSYSDVSVNVRQSDSAGGMAGTNLGIIDHSFASGQIGAAGSSGGLVGDNGGTISNSHASGETECGGLVCKNAGAKAIIENCFATGNVVGFGGPVGGLAGFSNNRISGSFTTGTVTGQYAPAAGGLVGALSGGEVRDSYALGTISGGDAANGGLIGLKSSDSVSAAIETSYAIGPVTGTGYDGGIVGKNRDRPSGFQSMYWDETTSQLDVGCGSGRCQGVAALSDAQLKSGLPKGFDRRIWGQSANINNGYPYLLANPPAQ